MPPAANSRSPAFSCARPRPRARRRCAGSRSWPATTPGGDDTRPLLYATADARKVHDILTRLGACGPRTRALVLGGGMQDVLSALAKVAQQAGEAARRGERTALLFYYSGHAKDGALRLGETRLPIDALKGRLAARPST